MLLASVGVKARSAAKHSTVYKAALHNKDLSSPNVNSIDTEKPYDMSILPSLVPK